MKTISLTDEQAKWLLEFLDHKSAERAWDSVPERTDADEHTDAIRAKLAAEIRKHDWGHGT